MQDLHTSPFFDVTLGEEIVAFMLDPGATLPTRKTEGSAGYDISSIETAHFQRGQMRMIRTGVYVDSLVPMMLKMRSSMVKRGFAMPDWGLIDEDYRGELLVAMIYTGWPTDWRNPLNGVVEAGEAFAQLVFFDCYKPRPVVTLGLSQTKRGSGGWGSTGRV